MKTGSVSEKTSEARLSFAKASGEIGPLHATQPKTNVKFWRIKIARNQARDRLVTRTLRRAGWRVLRVWEHELRKNKERRLWARLRSYGLVSVDQKVGGR